MGDVYFVIDSGATNHVVNDESICVSFKDLNSPIAIETAKEGQYVYATKKGRFKI